MLSGESKVINKQPLKGCCDVWSSFLQLSLKQKLADFPFPKLFPLEFLWKKFKELSGFWPLFGRCLHCVFCVFRSPRSLPATPCPCEQRGGRLWSLVEGMLTSGVIFMCLRQGKNVLLLSVSSKRFTTFQGEELEGKSKE